MARKVAEKDLQTILNVIARHHDGLSAQQVRSKLGNTAPLRTLQYRLKHLVEQGKLVQKGQARATRYRIADETGADNVVRPAFVSKAGASIQEYVTRPLGKRKPVGYARTFLDSHRPNEVFYLSDQERAHLYETGKPQVAGPPSSTYTGQTLNRLLVDLSWNSSRLEGNTYSWADTRRLIHFGQATEGKDRLEAHMILNHKDAIEFLITNATGIGFNRYTILNLHAILANNLLADPDSPGRLRQIMVKIEGSTFHPPGGIPQIIEECFDQILATAEAIRDPFEQAFFVMVQLPYLQPFDDVNKRVSRLSANISLIKAGLSPLSFKDVPKDLYTQANLGIYELNRTALLKDIFIWAYERSAAHYAIVQQSLGEPDPLKLRYHEPLHEIIHTVVCKAMGRASAGAYVSKWTADHIATDDREALRENIETELLSLHEGNFARYRIQPSEFRAWQKAWSTRAPI